jgi:hypothetical protein
MGGISASACQCYGARAATASEPLVVAAIAVVAIFTLGQLQKAAANELPISVQLKEDGVWQLTGHVKGTAHHA